MDNIKIIGSKGLTFDDVLIVPNYTEVKREDVDVSSYLSKNIKLEIPLLSSPMDFVTASEMAIAIGKLGGLGVIHRNMVIEDQVKEITTAKKEIEHVAAAVGVGRDLEERIEAINQAQADIVLIDSAHGFSKQILDAVKFIKEKYRNLVIIAGNVATGAAAKAIIEAGAGVVRVGMGPGSICTTRIIAGVGIPQITAILETSQVARKYGAKIIADGGLRNSGDVVKAIAAGADMVMSGSLFAGCKEAPGKIITIKGKKFKNYRGMGSVAAMKEGSAARYGQEYRIGQEKKLIPEGVEGMVSYKGGVSDVVNQIIGGLRTGMYYTGVKTISELQEKTRFIRVTQASLIESYPHDILMNNE